MNNEWLDAPNSDGLWWVAFQNADSWIYEVVLAKFLHTDGTPKYRPYQCMGRDKHFTIEDFSRGKWQKIPDPIMPA